MPKKRKEDTARITLNITSAERALIDRAAELTGKTRTNFILNASHNAAEEVILDRVSLLVGAQAPAAFLARLDAAPQPNARLQRSLQYRPSWDE
jgi:uncharacterized protein (DUF1778 family)